MTLLEDFALLLDTLVSLLLDFGVALEEDVTTLLLEFSSFADEEDCLSSLEAGFAEELDSVVFSTDEDDSSLGSVAGAELFESSPQAANKTATINSAKIFFTENLPEPQSFLPNLNY